MSNLSGLAIQCKQAVIISSHPYEIGAEANAGSHGLGNTLNFVQFYRLECAEGSPPAEPFDLTVNPDPHIVIFCLERKKPRTIATELDVRSIAQFKKHRIFYWRLPGADPAFVRPKRRQDRAEYGRPRSAPIHANGSM